MKLLLVVLNRDEKLDELLAGFVEVGLTGATILESVGMGEALARDVPIFREFTDLRRGSRTANKVVLSLVEDGSVSAALGMVETVCGPFDEAGSGIACVLPIERALGLKPPIG